jgi:hypothetical protein
LRFRNDHDFFLAGKWFFGKPDFSLADSLDRALIKKKTIGVNFKGAGIILGADFFGLLYSSLLIGAGDNKGMKHDKKIQNSKGKS